MDQTVSFQPYIARLRDFMARSTSSPTTSATDEMEFNGLVVELFRAQCRCNEALRRWVQSQVPGAKLEAFRHWTDIPALPTAGFKEIDLTVLPPQSRSRVFLSSGTTLRASSRHYHSADSLAVYEASLWPWFERHLLGDAVPVKLDVLVLAPAGESAPHSSLVHMFETVCRRYGPERRLFAGRVDAGGVWHLDAAGALRFLEESVAAGRPVMVLGTAFMFVHLLDAVADSRRRLVLPPGSRALETGGYKGRSRVLEKSELHRLLTHFLGIPEPHIVCEYGMAELSSQGYDRVAGVAARGGFRFPAWARVRVVSPETGAEVAIGERGLIQVYDLANVYSCVAVQTEDLGIRRAEGCELIGRAALSEARGCSLLTA